MGLAGAAAGLGMGAYSVQIGRVYDGPLDLLLDLIRKQDVDIYDIPIARLTGQYLAYLEGPDGIHGGMDVEVAAEFLLMAATLIHIKSKLLLPATPALPGEAPEEDPRQELVARLLEYEKFQQAAAMLRERQLIEDASWRQPGIREFRGAEAPEPDLAVGIYDLAQAFQRVLRRLEERPTLEIAGAEVTVAEMVARLEAWLAASNGPLRLQAVLGRAVNRRALVACFLALLEMVRRGDVQLRQERVMGDIWLRRAARQPGEARA
ncbi:MAG: segregation and condensation protein A [Terriglobales bacterium]